MTYNLLALFAHPDDETMLCGGTLALLAGAGVRVHFACATRGEGGEMGEPPVAAREALGQVRSQELACAVRALGASSLCFLDYIDPLVGPDEALYPFTGDMEGLVLQILAKIDETGSNALLTHGSNGEYGHPAHILLHQAARAAVSRAANPIAMYTVQACFEGHPKPRLANPDDPADLVIDVRPYLAQKIRAADCHRSQHALFVRRTSERLGRRVEIPEVVMQVESLHRVRFTGEAELQDDLFEVIQQTGLASSSWP